MTSADHSRIFSDVAAVLKDEPEVLLQSLLCLARRIRDLVRFSLGEQIAVHDDLRTAKRWGVADGIQFPERLDFLLIPRQPAAKPHSVGFQKPHADGAAGVVSDPEDEVGVEAASAEEADTDPRKIAQEEDFEIPEARLAVARAPEVPQG